MELKPIADLSTIGQELLAVDLLGIKVPKISGSHLKLSAYTGSQFFLCNPTAADAEIIDGTMLVGFGKIVFRQLKEGALDFDSECDLMYAPLESNEYCTVDRFRIHHLWHGSADLGRSDE